MKNVNALKATDAYKTSHRNQYHPLTEYIFSNFTPRSDKLFPHYSTEDRHGVIFFGLQAVIKDFVINLWNNGFFYRKKSEVVSEYRNFLVTSLGADKDVDLSHIESLHDLGYLPLEIRALPEGSLVPIQVPVYTVVNTHPDFGWLTNYFETPLSAETWKPSTNATISFQYLKLCDEYADLTCDNKLHLPFQCHDFSARGLSGLTDGYYSGVAHLTSFSGTDTILAIEGAEDNYGMKGQFVAGSIPASEHSVATTNITYNMSKLDQSVQELDEQRYLAEKEFLLRYITDIYPSGTVSYVADSYNYFSVISRMLPELKNEIMSREGRLVIRPDCYDGETKLLTDNGFKFFKDLLPTDLVAQVLDDGSYEFTKPLKYVAEHYEGDMIKFNDQNGKLDLLVTPNHRMIYTRNGTEVVTEAKDMPEQLHHYHHFSRSAKAKEDVDKRLTWKQRLAIAFQADGSFCTGCAKTKIRFSFSKERKISRILNIISKCGYESVVYDLKDGKKEIHTAIDFGITKDFSWVGTDMLTAQWCRDFIEEVSYWDAHRRSDTRFKVDSTTKSVIDVIELVALSAGYGVYRTETEDNRKEIFLNIHTLHIMKNNKLGGQGYTKETTKDFSGTVYCVKVQTGRIIVKRNKCVMVCGNSGDPVHIIAGYHIEKFSSWATLQTSPIQSETEVIYLNSTGKYYLLDHEATVNHCISEEYEISYAEAVGTIRCEWNTFGGTVNNKGYKVVDSHIGLIYGDSITVQRAKEIFKRLEAKGFASSNIVFGVGAFSFNYSTRDTFGFACKATGAVIDGKEFMICKEPKTDTKKKSAKGFIKVVKDGKSFKLVDNLPLSSVNDKDNDLQLVFKDGVEYNTTTLTEIRERVKSNL